MISRSRSVGRAAATFSHLQPPSATPVVFPPPCLDCRLLTFAVPIRPARCCLRAPQQCHADVGELIRGCMTGDGGAEAPAAAATAAEEDADEDEVEKMAAELEKLSCDM